MRVNVDIQQVFSSGGHDFNLDVAFACDEDITVIFGQSGAGKSLLLKIIAGLKSAKSGKIVVNDSTLFDSEKGIAIDSKNRNFGYLFQDYALFPHKTVSQNIGFSKARIFGGELDFKDAKRVHELLEIFQIQNIKEKFPAEISGGQRQRVGLARALLQKPNMLLLDEPFSALDPLLRIHMRQELKKIQCLFDIPILLITHDPQDVAELGQRLIVLNQGAVTDSVDLTIPPYRDQDGSPRRSEIRKLLFAATGVPRV